MDSSDDGGFAYRKHRGNSKRVSFPSIGGEINRSDFSLSNGKPNILDITTSEGSWLFGRSALFQSAMSSRRQDSRWVLSPVYLAGLLVSISETISNQTHKIDVSLTTGLPYSDWSNKGLKEEMRQRLLGMHSIWRIDCPKQIINIEKVSICPQNLGAIFYHILDNDGNLKPLEKESFLIGSINIGGHTVELATVELLNNQGKIDFDVIEAQSTSRPWGMFSILSNLRNALSKEFPGERWSDYELFDILRKDTFSPGDKSYDISDITSPIKLHYQNRIISLMTQNWSDQFEMSSLSRLYSLVLTGGGVDNQLQKRVAQHKDNLLVSDNTQWDTALGYEKLAKFLQKDK